MLVQDTDTAFDSPGEWRLATKAPIPGLGLSNSHRLAAVGMFKTLANELARDGVLLNTGIAHARDPLTMAHAMRHALDAGRLAYLAGRIPKRLYATASSPDAGMISPGAR